MKKFEYYDESEINLFKGLMNLASSWAYAITLIAKIAMLGILCFNPVFTILIKNIFVLEFCSMLILFNINYHNQVYEQLRTLYDITQGQIYPNFYKMAIEHFSKYRNWRGNINRMGNLSFLIENAGFEFNIITVSFNTLFDISYESQATLILFLIFKIIINCTKKHKLALKNKKIVKIERPKFHQAYSIITKLFVMLYGFFSFDYWFATILDISNMTRSINNKHTVVNRPNYYSLKITISSGSSILILIA